MLTVSWLGPDTSWSLHWLAVIYVKPRHSLARYTFFMYKVDKGIEVVVCEFKRYWEADFVLFGQSNANIFTPCFQTKCKANLR